HDSVGSADDDGNGGDGECSHLCFQSRRSAAKASLLVRLFSCGASRIVRVRRHSSVLTPPCRY
ncbi:MAG TPA: hypothetical protein VL485_29505, partial [Ktedonobacteraceae bacterium]|nr:hypothetical protein [Ktedonobacteraceae bacterium]